jgi:hypothetical protein
MITPTKERLGQPFDNVVNPWKVICSTNSLAPRTLKCLKLGQVFVAQVIYWSSSQHVEGNDMTNNFFNKKSSSETV